MANSNPLVIDLATGKIKVGPPTVSGGKAQVGLAVNRPVASGSGNIYQCIDASIMYIDDPTLGTWQQCAGEYMPNTVTAVEYTTVGAISLIQVADSIRAAFASNTTSKAACALTQQNIGAGGYPANLNATTPFAVTVVATAVYYLGYASPTIGVIVTDGVTDGVSVGYAASWEMDGNSPAAFRASKITVDGAQITNYAGTNGMPIGFARAHARIVNDGVLFHFQASPDGALWSDVVSENNVAGLTYYGFNVGSTNNNTGAWSIALVNSNNLSIPTQVAVTACAGGFGSPQLTVGAGHPFQPGDQVSVQGMLPLVSMPNTAAGTGYSGVANTGATFIKATTSTTITIDGQCPGGSGAYTGGGVVTLLSR